ncbi:MAG TPA: threonine aldolase family protein [Vicinamibacterales bacterium]|jgi:threonine aldolase|nr:threonine aldolase family protein [Vicinamibacterales bacterium]
MIDLRSDTVTRPTDGMRAAMAAAPVGDDQFGEDPTINELQSRVAALLGKEAALWLPSGTMANQVALRALTRPGDDVIVSRESHAVWHETGGGGANAGVQFTEIGSGGRFTADEFIAAIKPRDHMLYPPTTLVQVENTHNRAGGVVIDQGEAIRICAAARERRITTFLDGARLWNAAVASGKTVAELAAPFDVASVALSKGLGAPAGTMLAGPRDVMRNCVRHRRMLGGAMRQVGILGAAGLYALDHHLDRLSDDHDNAKLIASRLRRHRHISLAADPVETNIVIFSLDASAPDAAAVIAAARAQGVLVVAFGPRTVRAVTHLDVTREQCERAASVLGEAIAGGPS